MVPVRTSLNGAAAGSDLGAEVAASHAAGGPAGEQLRVFIVSAVRLYREGLVEALESRGVSVVGTAGTDDGMESLAQARPDVILVTAGSGLGVDEIRRAAAAAPESRVVVLAVPDAHAAIVALAEAGACGFVTIEASLDDLITAIASAGRNELACSPTLTAAFVRRIAVLASGALPEDRSTRLTPRETEITELVTRGLSNKEIATQLHIEVATVKNHVHNILDKLGLSRRTQIAQFLRQPTLLGYGSVAQGNL